MDESNLDFFHYILLTSLIALSIFFLIDYNQTRELGQAICSERIGKDYKSYDDGILKCKSKELKVVINYDGIIIELENVK